MRKKISQKSHSSHGKFNKEYLEIFSSMFMGDNKVQGALPNNASQSDPQSHWVTFLLLCPAYLDSQGKPCISNLHRGGDTYLWKVLQSIISKLISTQWHLPLHIPKPQPVKAWAPTRQGCYSCLWSSRALREREFIRRLGHSKLLLA